MVQTDMLKDTVKSVRGAMERRAKDEYHSGVDKQIKTMGLNESSEDGQK